MSSLWFPVVYPQKINFDFPTLLSQSEDFVSGYEHKFLNSQDGWGMKFELVYKYLTEVELRQFLRFYKDVRGEWKTFSLPHAIWRHPLPLRAELEPLLENCAFRFNGKPEINVISSDVYDLTINLITDLDFENRWLEYPPNMNNRVNLIIQDNMPVTERTYWIEMENQYNKLYEDIRTAVPDNYLVKQYFISSDERHLKYLFNLPPNYKTISNVLITGNGFSYTGESSWAYEDQATLDKVVAQLKFLNGKKYLTNHIYYFQYPESVNNPILQDVSDLASDIYDTNILDNIVDSINFINVDGNFSPYWGGNRETIFQDIINKLTP